MGAMCKTMRISCVLIRTIRWQDECKQLLQPAAKPITWRRSRSVDTPPAYWSYLRRYPRGSHANDARRRLAYLTAALEPPPRFEIINYAVPPPPPEEVIYVERPVLIFDVPGFGFE